MLKRLCRQRTAVAWKEWRASVEADYASALQVHFHTKLFLLCTVKQTFTQCYQAAAEKHTLETGSSALYTGYACV